MTRFMARLTLAGAAAAVLAGAAAVPAQAVPAQAAAGQDYAAHVRACQAEMGFSGTHNPGVMHRGYSGWDPTHLC